MGCRAGAAAMSKEPGKKLAPGETRDITAEKGDKKLGLKFDHPPPGLVTVGQITDNQWAGMSGVSMGDQLIAVNGDLCEEMTTDAFKKHMSGRPVICTFRNPAAPAGGKEAKPAKASKEEVSAPKKDDKEKEKEK